METTLEQLGPLQWQLTLGLDGKKVDGEVERRLAEFRPRARVPGFRRGKAPTAVLERHYGDQLRKEEWQRLAQAELRRELAERGLRPVTAPRMAPVPAETGVRATFEVFPILPAFRFGELTVRRPRVEIQDSDVDYMIDRLLEEQKNWRPVDRPSMAGDRVELEVVAAASGWRWPRKGRRKVKQTVGGDGFFGFLGDQLAGINPGDLLEVEAVPPSGHDLARGQRDRGVVAAEAPKSALRITSRPRQRSGPRSRSRGRRALDPARAARGVDVRRARPGRGGGDGLGG